MFENPRRGRQGRNFTTNVPKILVLKSSSEQIFSRKLPLGAPEKASQSVGKTSKPDGRVIFTQKNGLKIKSTIPGRNVLGQE